MGLAVRREAGRRGVCTEQTKQKETESMDGQTHTDTRTHTSPLGWRPRREEVKKQLASSVPGCSEGSPNSLSALPRALGPPQHFRPGAQGLGVQSRRHGPPRVVSSHDHEELPGEPAGRSVCLTWACFLLGSSSPLAHHSLLCMVSGVTGPHWPV